MPITAAFAGDLSLLADTIWSAGTALTQSVRRRAAAADEAEDVSVAVGADALELAAPAWRRLEEAGGAATPFQTLALAQQAAAVHLRRGETPRIVVVHDASGRPAVVFPTVVGRLRAVPTVRFLGDPLIQYGDVIAAPGTPPALLEAAWRAAASPGAASLIHLRKVRTDARIAPVLARHTSVLAEHRAPFVDVDQPTAAPSRYVRELRRLRRRLAETGEVRFETLCGPDAAGAVREALDLKRAWLAARGMPSTVVGDADWERGLLDLALDANGAAPLHAARLTAGARTAALEIALVHGGRWCAFLGAVSPDFVKTGPGHLQMAETIAHCRAAGVATYDLLAPADAYKNLIAHGAVAVRDHAAAIGLGGWPGLAAARAVPAVKRLLGLCPPWLRRTLTM